MARVFGAFRSDTTLTAGQAAFGGVGTSFEISAFSTIDIDLGADTDTITGDLVTNENPDDSTQTFLGEAIAWDYNYNVTDGTNTYTIGVFDYDLSGNTAFELGGEQGFFLGFIGDVPPLNTTLTITSLGDGAFADPTDGLPVSSFVPCFVNGTKLVTQNGDKCVDDLVPGDTLLRYAPSDSTPQFATILRVFCRKLTASEITANPKLRPVRIMAHALGGGLPKRDLLVSRQHRMLVRSKIVQRMFGVDEVLVPAIKLTALPGIFVDEEIDHVSYYHLLFDQHEVIYAEDAPTESLYTGPETLKSISSEAREEILTIFPELANLKYTPDPARHIPTGKLQKQLVERHLKNKKPLFY
ncbi:Hint domain-containing protein [Roseovarius rhodophyticola]|uniref:Hint domain-containing protein n=1 Tax=Roseovarius rhodophyticola TaxID=3080827 RepID=A0ABZ2THR6_9RHOB|nr:Hint domain-containing protein [Roseovarius sp. W115]MDV2929531.1 Hint domain-containing protein [Roseovarius sp. W115]